MSEWVFVAKVEEFPPGESKVVVREGEEVAVFNVEGTFYATGNRCPKKAGSYVPGTAGRFS
jgi:3-phenylpropionate/trans-cinnamate dioxygenase ferredoxin subunit